MTLLSVKGGEDVGTAREDRVEAASEEVGVLKAPLHKHVGRLGDALLGKVDVHPAGEYVCEVPLALAVPNEDEAGVRRGCARCSRSPRAGSRSRSPR